MTAGRKVTHTVDVCQSALAAPLRAGVYSLSIGDRQILASRLIFGPAFIETPHALASQVRMVVSGNGATVRTTCDAKPPRAVQANATLKIAAL